MIDLFYFAGFPVAVFGLGKSGVSTCKALMKAKAEVWAWDDDEETRKRAEAEGIPLVNLYLADWKELTTLVLSPGIPHLHPKPHPVAELARNAGVEVVCDVELLARAQRDAAYIGVTGTNGKSTTTVMIGHILETSGREAEMGGNLGIPALDLLPLDQNGTYVLEMSSYQLERTLSITFDVAVLLNLSPDHEDRHGGMDGYARAKKLIFHRQTDPRTAVICIDDKWTQAIYEELKEKGDQILIPVSTERKLHGGVYVVNGVLVDDTQGQETPVCDLKEIPSLPGQHNWQNAACAYAACLAAKVEATVIVACLKSYGGLVHRQEPVDVVDGVAFVNDSKATNADAARRALACYDDVYWIAGGRPKEGGIGDLGAALAPIRHTFLIGEAALSFGQTLDGKVPFTISGDLKTAVSQAFEAAKRDGLKEAVVLLSPACASFDQYDNFEDRGDAFKELVEALPGEHVDPFELPGVFPGTGTAARAGGDDGEGPGG